MSAEFRSEGLDLPIARAQVESTGLPGGAPLRDGDVSGELVRLQEKLEDWL